jgi:hypothetical protein
MRVLILNACEPSDHRELGWKRRAEERGAETPLDAKPYQK